MKFRDKYYFLSNMFPCNILYNGINYKSVESAFQAQKDPSRINEFINLDGFAAKKLGRKVTLRKDWETIKLSIMEDLLRVKFSDKTLHDQLLAVTEPIVEDNTWHDTFWGICNGKGENNLGKLLEKIKNESIT
mgnify:CR=1 FL=1